MIQILNLFIFEPVFFDFMKTSVLKTNQLYQNMSIPHNKLP